MLLELELLTLFLDLKGIPNEIDGHLRRRIVDLYIPKCHCLGVVIIERSDVLEYSLWLLRIGVSQEIYNLGRHSSYCRLLEKHHLNIEHSDRLSDDSILKTTRQWRNLHHHIGVKVGRGIVVLREAHFSAHLVHNARVDYLAKALLGSIVCLRVQYRGKHLIIDTFPLLVNTHIALCRASLEYRESTLKQRKKVNHLAIDSHHYLITRYRIEILRDRDIRRQHNKVITPHEV